MADQDLMKKLPPVLTFQSVVDETVDASAIFRMLYSALPKNGSELVVYDVNRHDAILPLMRNAPEDLLSMAVERAPLDFSVTIVTNRHPSAVDVDAQHLPAGENAPEPRELNLLWPRGVYSLSHIALPMRPDDPVYGDGTNLKTTIALGAAAPRGERFVLSLTPDYFLRLRYNPFYGFQANRMRTWLRNF
ncbi:MAG: hypothetical protein P8Y95_09575 [Gammaproteobacteria bacterium]